MKEKTLAKIVPYVLDGHLIISLDGKWLEVFNGNPVFEVVLSKTGHLLLHGPQVKRGCNT